MTKILSAVNELVWGVPGLLLIVSVGLALTLRLGVPQLRLLPHALYQFFRMLGGKGDSSFRCLCTALGGTVGTGNLVGVAGAICLGGPGAVFWIWVCGFLGMVTKFAEATLAVRYRVRTTDGFLGGPMYVITEALGSRYRCLAVCYSLFGLIASFGVGNATQISSVITGLHGLLEGLRMPCPVWLDLTVGIALAALLGKLLLGGAGTVGKAAEILVPVAAAGYILLCCGVLAVCAQRIPEAFFRILTGALDPKAVTGGCIGSAFVALRIGCSRGVFTNEAGMGTAAIAHGEARVDHPARQGLMGIVEVFLDTMVICTLTALVILVSGVPIPYGREEGGRLTMAAFASVYGSGANLAVTAMLTVFAVATVLSWGMYGGRCAQFLFGNRAWNTVAAAHILVMLLSAVLDTGSIWLVSETLNGLMAIPNLIMLAVLLPEVSRLTKEYTKIRRKNAGGGTYADFHQCKPL